MDSLDVRPGVGIGPVDIGMPRPAAVAAATAVGLRVEDFRRGVGPGKPDLAINGQLFAYVDGTGLVHEIEVAIPADGDDELPVTCLDLDLAAPFDIVQSRMAELGRVDETDPEYPGTSVYLELGLVFWADATTEDLAHVCVESILVRRPELGPVD